MTNAIHIGEYQAFLMRFARLTRWRCVSSLDSRLNIYAVQGGFLCGGMLPQALRL